MLAGAFVGYLGDAAAGSTLIGSKVRRRMSADVGEQIGSRGSL
jgi:hypothetical protein